MFLENSDVFFKYLKKSKKVKKKNNMCGKPKMWVDSNYFGYQLHAINKIYKNKVTNYKITFTYLWLER